MVSHSKVTSSGKSSAPLWTWVTAAAVVLIFIGVSYHWFFRADCVDHFNPRRLERFASPVNKDTLRVAVIGTSLTRNAFYKDDAMESFANGRGVKIRFLRFTLSGGSLGDFYDLSEAVIGSGADMICFESAIFGLDMGSNPVALDRYRYYVRHGGTKLLAHLPFVPKRRRSDPQNGNYAAIELPQTPLPGATSDKAAEQYLKTAAQFRIRDFAEGKKFAALFSKARERGKVVVFLDLSRSRKAWDMLPVNFEKKFTETMGRYEKAYGIHYLRFPYHLPLDYFLDFAHLGPKGRRFYSEWFLANLASLSGDVGK